jgi:D-xylulose reductase
MEPLSVGVHSVATLAQLRTGQSIAVWGAGPVGLLCMAVAKALGASRIVAIDINRARLDFAKSYVATDVFFPPAPNPNETKVEYSKRTAEALKQALGIEDRGPTAIDVVIEASGAEASIQTALFVVKTGGTYVQV